MDVTIDLIPDVLDRFEAKPDLSRQPSDELVLHVQLAGDVFELRIHKHEVNYHTTPCDPARKPTKAEAAAILFKLGRTVSAMRVAAPVEGGGQ